MVSFLNKHLDLVAYCDNLCKVAYEASFFKDLTMFKPITPELLEALRALHHHLQHCCELLKKADPSYPIGDYPMEVLEGWDVFFCPHCRQLHPVTESGELGLCLSCQQDAADMAQDAWDDFLDYNRNRGR